MPPHANKDRPLAALIVPDLLELLEEHPESIGPQTEEMHPADLADIAEALPEDMVRAFLSALPKERAGEVLEYLDESLRTMVLEELTAVEAASIMSEMTPDERADALEELDDETADEILAEFEPEEKAETERLLEYDPYTAGGLMTTEFVSVDENLTAEEALGAVRARSRAGRREAMYTVYTIDGNGRLRARHRIVATTKEGHLLAHFPAHLTGRVMQHGLLEGNPGLGQPLCRQLQDLQNTPPSTMKKHWWEQLTLITALQHNIPHTCKSFVASTIRASPARAR